MDFKIRGVYSFDVYPASLLGTNFKNVTVLAVMDFETANKEIDARARHVNFYPHLPAGTINNPAGYDYIKIKTTAGNVTILGLAWINLDSVVEVENRTAIVTIKNVTATDVPRIKNALAQNGFGDVVIEIKQ